MTDISPPACSGIRLEMTWRRTEGMKEDELNFTWISGVTLGHAGGTAEHHQSVQTFSEREAAPHSFVRRFRNVVFVFFNRPALRHPAENLSCRVFRILLQQSFIIYASHRSKPLEVNLVYRPRMCLSVCLSNLSLFHDANISVIVTALLSCWSHCSAVTPS